MRRRACVTAVALLLASCTGGTTPSRVPSAAPDPRVQGAILVRSGFGGVFELVELPDGEVTALRMPNYERTLAGFFDDDGSVIGLLEVGGGARLYRLFPDEEPVALGPPLPPTDTTSHGGGTVLVTGCGTPPFARALDLASPGAWREVEAGCGAALAPPGRVAAWSPDETTIVEGLIDGSREPDVVADVRQLPISGDASFVGPVAWGVEGRAVLVSTPGWQAVASEPDYGTLTPLGDRGSGPPQASLDWQADGPMLAIASSTTLGGTVRVVDGDTSTVVAMFGEPATGAVWAPQGDVLLAASNGVWAIVTTDGEWLWSRIEGGGQEPLDWRPST